MRLGGHAWVENDEKIIATAYQCTLSQNRRPQLDNGGGASP